MRYKVFTYHGEGRTVFYVVDTRRPSPKQPAVVKSFAGPPMFLEDAELYARQRNEDAARWAELGRH